MPYQVRSHLPWSNTNSGSNFLQKMTHESPLHRKLEVSNRYHTFSAVEGFIRGRSYNIILDDQILLKFSPKNSDSTYYFNDMIGGTLTFFHEEGARRFLEVLMLGVAALHAPEVVAAAEIAISSYQPVISLPGDGNEID